MNNDGKDYDLLDLEFLGQPTIYQALNPGLNIEFNVTRARENRCLCLNGMAYSDRKYKLAYNQLTNFKFIVTDSDLLAHDDYIELLKKTWAPEVIIYFENASYAPSRLRIDKAILKLKAHGIKTKFFLSKLKAENYVLRQNAMLNKKHHEIVA